MQFEEDMVGRYFQYVLREQVYEINIMKDYQ